MFARVMSALMLFVTSACSARQPDARGTDLTLHCGASGSLVSMTLNDERIEAIAGALEEMADFPDVVGEEMARWTRPNGLDIARVRTGRRGVIVLFETG